MGRSLLQSLFLTYLRVLRRTLRMEWVEDQVGPGRQIFGFWHEDSFCMNLVLEQVDGRTKPVHVIVTADTRGDYIERMVESCGGHALRVADGRASFGKLKEILEELRGRDTSLAVALDGPLGPRHEPKGLAFYFAELLGAEFTGFTLRYSACIRLWRRWDKYAIPLPFSKVTVRAHGYGRVTRKNMPALPAAPRDKNPDFLSGEGSSILGGEKQKIQTAGGNYGNQSYLDRGR
ncbi:DUF374 domain-containing protein [Faecalicatena contorta]|nr:DUF374 domain-containing protein [Faecalicatena contorta]MBM6709187.1 DUF374 domain-containing protein [Faecalicatena contorta]